jgi:uncharacterized protein YlzI (FlbEa/FlbD family)
MRFIELHKRDGEPVLINVHHILAISRFDEESTDITMSDGITFVKETPDEILLKIRG